MHIETKLKKIEEIEEAVELEKGDGRTPRLFTWQAMCPSVLFCADIRHALLPLFSPLPRFLSPQKFDLNFGFSQLIITLMRFIVYSVFLAGWIGLWWWTYVYHIKACVVYSGSVPGVNVEYAQNALIPLSFKWSDPTPILSDHFAQWRDSVINALGEEQILEVTGISYRDESPVENISDLGTQRAKAIKHVFSATLPDARILERADVGEITADIRNKNFLGYRLRTLTQNEDILETGDCTLIYFPFDSTTLVGNTAIDDHLADLHTYLAETGESVKLLTLVDQENPENSDHRLTLWRMHTLKDMLVSVGIPPDKVRLGKSDEEVPPECIPEGMKTEVKDWIALIFVK